MVEYEEIPKDCFLKFFPRNLSYTEEGFLDNFSTCWPFVRERRSKHVKGYFESRIHYDSCDSDSAADPEMSDLESSAPETAEGLKVRSMNGMADEKSNLDPENGIKCECSDLTSEEGVFVNMMDDLDSVESPESRASVGSDLSYFSLESVGSPEEAQELDENALRNLSEAVSKGLEKKKNIQYLESENNVETDEEPPEVKVDKPVDNVKRSSITGEHKLSNLKIEMKNKDFLTTSSQRYLLQVPDSPVYEEPEFNINKAELRKSSSLKTTKTPPGTPSRKKMVRFADVMGLDLESIRHVLDTELPPRIPTSAMKDLQVGVEKDRKDVGSRYLDLCFGQPGADPGFMARVMADKVSLENCIITDLSITGVVRVANIGYHKYVRIRYSINNWVSFYDIMASYIQNSCDGTTDRFSFTIVSPSAVGPGSKISFAVSYTVNDTMYWDSNNGKNYEVVCYAKTTPTALEESWLHFV